MKQSGCLMAEQKRLAPFMLGFLWVVLGTMSVFAWVSAFTTTKENMIPTMAVAILCLLILILFVCIGLRTYRLYSAKYYVDGAVVTNQYKNKQTTVDLDQPFSVCKFEMKMIYGKMGTVTRTFFMLWNSADTLEFDHESGARTLREALKQGAVWLPDEGWCRDLLLPYTQQESIPTYPDFLYHNT